MPAKPQKDMGPPKAIKIGERTAYISEPKNKKPFKAGDIKITIDTTKAEAAIAEIRKAFDIIGQRLADLWVEWLQSPEGKEAMNRIIKEELKR